MAKPVRAEAKTTIRRTIEDHAVTIFFDVVYKQIDDAFWHPAGVADFYSHLQIRQRSIARLFENALYIMTTFPRILFSPSK
jgi:hypothetical protein